MLTQQQLDSFHANGYLIMRGLIQGRELALLQEAAESVVNEGVSRQGVEHKYHTYPDGREVYWRSEQMWLRGDIFQSVTVNPELLENIGQCIGQTFYPWNDSLVVKLPNSGAPVKWHQDPPYRNPDRETTFPVPNFTTDIYLDRSWTGNGCVFAIPGHHLVGHVDLEARSDAELFNDHGAVPLEMEAGDVLFHSLSTPHGSGPNPSDSTRRVFYLHYVAEEVFQDGYSRESWAREKPGWNKGRLHLIEEMMRVRESLGFEPTLKRGTIRYSEDGFSFTGAPTTVPRWWGTLAERIPQERRDPMKRLSALERPGN